MDEAIREEIQEAASKAAESKDPSCLFELLLSLEEKLTRPENVPEVFLLEVWNLVVGHVLSLVDLDKRAAGRPVPVELPLNTLFMFISQCPSIPFQEFWDKCIEWILQPRAATEKAVKSLLHQRRLLPGLLELMHRQHEKFPCPGDEAHVRAATRLVFLLRLVLGADPASEYYNYILEAVSDSVGPDGLILGCFETTLELLQMPNFTSAVPLVDPVYRNALQLLKEAREDNQAQWKACFSACLRRVFLLCREHGVGALSGAAVKRVLLLFSRPSLASHFLDALLGLPECGERTKGAIALAFQIFEAAYRRNARVIIATCAAKLVEESADNVSMRVECLTVLSRVHARWCDESEDAAAKPAWTEAAARDLMRSCLFDPSIRVRRAAIQLCARLQPDRDGVAQQELLYLVFLKLRDNDEKVRRSAFRQLAAFPTATLARHFQGSDWQLVFQHGFREEGMIHDVQDLLYEYLSSEDLEGPPSARLSLLGNSLHERESLCSSLRENIESIFKQELLFWAQSEQLS